MSEKIENRLLDIANQINNLDHADLKVDIRIALENIVSILTRQEKKNDNYVKEQMLTSIANSLMDIKDSLKEISRRK